jgi:hypothetical protein
MVSQPKLVILRLFRVPAITRWQCSRSHRVLATCVCKSTIFRITHSHGRFEVFTAVTMKNTVFWYVSPCGSFKYRRFEGTYRLHHQGGKNQRARNSVNSNQQPQHAVEIVFLRSVRRLLASAIVFPTSPIPVTLILEAAMSSSETPVLTSATRHHIPEDGILHITTVFSGTDGRYTYAPAVNTVCFASGLPSDLYVSNYCAKTKAGIEWFYRIQKRTKNSELERSYNQQCYKLKITFWLPGNRRQLLRNKQSNNFSAVADTLLQLDRSVLHISSLKQSVPFSSESQLLVAVDGCNDNEFRVQQKRSKIWDFHDGDYEEQRLLGCYTAWLL